MPRPLSLGRRLMAAVGFIRPHDRVLDIGTDHARLPVYLMEQNLCASVTATDRAEGPLERARRTLRAHRLEDTVPLLLCDGAQGIDPSEFDTVVIAGMGADTIVSIVSQCPWLRQKRLITQPQTRVNGFAGMMEGFTLKHRMEITDNRRTYTIFVFEGESDYDHRA